MLQAIQLKAYGLKMQAEKEKRKKERSPEEWKEIFAKEIGYWINEWNFFDRPTATLKIAFSNKDVFIASITRTGASRKRRGEPKSVYTLALRGAINQLLLIQDIPPEALSEENVIDAIAYASKGMPEKAKKIFDPLLKPEE